MKFKNSLAFAKNLDRLDPLKACRNQFQIPKHNGKTSIYFTGNSLGLQPKSVSKYLNQELKDWGDLGVEGHFQSARPWLYYHKFSKKALGKLVGGKKNEVVAMNQLTVNLHLMLTSFYRPDKKRFKILTEAGAFSSDQYAIESHINLHGDLFKELGIEPSEVLIELKPRMGERALRTEDILHAIEEHKTDLTLVLFGAVQYYSGQLFDIRSIVKAAHHAGALAGFDLAHAIGNVPLQLHRDEVDFAVWCGYKYLNSGPGGLAGAYVHERHGNNFDIPRLAGWWGHNEGQRFQMKKGFMPMEGVDGWQVSNFPVFAGAIQLASLEIFNKVGINALRRKSKLLTGFLEYLLNQVQDGTFEIITPHDPASRGCQLSILMNRRGRKIFDTLTKGGVFADWREPDVIRVAPVPLYNSFEEVYRFVEIFDAALKEKR